MTSAVDGRVRAEQLRVRNLTGLIQSLGGLAHDFNNLLLAVRASLELIENRSPEPRLGALARRGLEAVDRGAAVTEQLRTLAGQKHRTAGPIDLAAAIRALAPQFEPLLGPGVTLGLTLNDGVAAAIVDDEQLELALLNLVLNAAEAMPEGGDLSIKLREVDFRLDRRPGRFAEIRVIDSGRGMTPEVAARAFQPFFSAKPDANGAGLGLAQAYAMARQSGGTTLIDSEPGRGTAVSILLPVSTILP